jgi:UDP-3-O-acyl N-acetylglucosamine deacetylase
MSIKATSAHSGRRGNRAKSTAKPTAKRGGVEQAEKSPRANAVYQQTIRKPVELAGVGIHSGRFCRMAMHPARSDSGIRFCRTDLPRRPIIPATVEYAVKSDAARCTILALDDEAQVATPEHLLAVCSGLGIDNLLIEIDQPECPILDGSSKVFTDRLREVGFKKLRKPRRTATIDAPLFCRFDDVLILALPSERLMLTYFMEYDPPYQLRQQIQFMIEPEIFANEIAPARTFCFKRDVPELRRQGLIQGGNIDLAVVLDEKGRPINEQRFTDEMVRHKILDLLGDLTLLGQPINCHILASRSGHASHFEFVKLLQKNIVVKGDHR